MTAEKSTHGSYLRGLMYREPVSEFMRKSFKKEYFAPPQKTTRPFMEQGEDQYQLQLLDAIADYLKLKVTFSGSSEKVISMLIPTEDKKYGENEELTRQIRQFSYWLVHRFESNTARQLLGKNEQIRNGKVKVVYIDGKPVAMTEDEIKNLSADQYVAMVQPGLMDALSQGTNGKELYSKSELLSDFRNTEKEAMQNELESAGLELIDIRDRDENGIITARVEDVNHQKLTVKINTNLENSSSAKFEFIFVDDPIANDSRQKERFSLSQNDLKRKFMDGEERKPAAQVARDLATPELSGPGEKTNRARAEVPNAIPSIPGSTPLGSRPTTLPTAPDQNTFEIPSPVGTPFGTSGQGTRGYTGRNRTKIRGRVGLQNSTKTKAKIRTTGKTLRPVKAPITRGTKPDQRQQQLSPQESKQQVANRSIINPGITTSVAQKPGKNMMGKIIAAGSVATATAGPAIATGAYLLSADDSAKKTALLILHCFGISCLA